MIKNFLVKKGDQLGFTLTFTSSLPISNIEWGVKAEYEDTTYTIYKSLNKLERKIVFIGDSYAEGYTPDGNVNGWPVVVKNKLGLDNTIIKYKGGIGFGAGLQAGTFTDLLRQVESDANVTHVIVCGGYNDRYLTRDAILTGIADFCNTAKSKFPNASIMIGACGWSSEVSQHDSLNKAIAAYQTGARDNNVMYLTDVENSLHGHADYFSSDHIHPNALGQNAIADNVIKYIPMYDSNGISKIDDRTYSFVLSSADTNILDYHIYPYDIRVKVGNNVKTPLSGKIYIKQTVFKEV